MNWQIQVPIPEYPFELSHYDRVISVGSCFEQQIADRLVHFQFFCMSTPYDTSFHPIPLLHYLTDSSKLAKIDEALFPDTAVVVFHFSRHSSVWNT